MTDKENKAQNKVQGTAALGGGMIASETAANEAAATDVLFEGLKLFLKKTEAQTPKPQLKGNLFEYIEVAKFNMEAERQGKPFIKARVTAETYGRGTDPTTDIEIYKKGKVVKKYQSKISKNDNYTARAISNKKYNNIDGHVLKDRVENIRKKVPGKQIKGELEYSGVSSGGTTKRELDIATIRPKHYVIKQETLQVAHEAAVTGLHAAVATAVMNGTISFLKNSYAYLQKTIDSKEGIKNIATDAGTSGLKSVFPVMLGTGIRYSANKVGVRALTKSNIAIGIAAGIIDTGSTILSLIKGEISSERATERLGNTACSTIAGITAGAFLGPAGSLAGYLIAEYVWTSCHAIIKKARLAEEEAVYVVALCTEAAKVMEKQREQFELALSEYLNEQRFAFDKCFETIDAALVEDRLIEAIQGISNLVIIFGKELQLSNFKDFDDFMTDSDEPLVL